MNAMEIYAIDIPNEPPVGSVVVGASGIAYQHTDRVRWFAADEYSGQRSWKDLLVKDQPLRLVYMGKP